MVECDQPELTKSNGSFRLHTEVGNRLLHTEVVRAVIEHCKQTRRHLEENGQGLEGTRNRANCTTVKGSACVSLTREDAGGRSSMKTPGKCVKICAWKSFILLGHGVQGQWSGRFKKRE